MKSFTILSALALGLPAFSFTLDAPLHERTIHFNEVANAQIEKRATKSSQGWYPYGCYFDCYDGMHRFLPVVAYVDANNNPDMCIQWCADNGHTYAGLQWTQECYCGDELAGPAAHPTECDHKCADGKNKCGGPCRNNIWSKFQKGSH
ncbi:hypothetical protein IAU60_003260 [Kwoniella sp. DSM 27419]